MNNSEAVGYGIEVDGIHHLFLGDVPNLPKLELREYYLNKVKQKEEVMAKCKECGAEKKVDYQIAVVRVYDDDSNHDVYEETISGKSIVKCISHFIDCDIVEEGLISINFTVISRP